MTEELGDTERAVLGLSRFAQAWSVFDGYTRDRLGSGLARILFRAGRIDAVWGVELADGRDVVIKAYRRPVDLAAATAARDAVRRLRSAGFPGPDPLSGPEQVGDLVCSAETLQSREAAPDGRDPADRRLLAAGLAEHIAILRGDDDLVGRAGSGPSWCRYQAGPWPVPHDPIVDFRGPVDGYAWLDDYAQRAADQILTHRIHDEVVIGHADWYGGNTAVAAGALVSTFDWELVADTEAVIAGFTAACYAASSTSGAGLSTPGEVADFLRDYETARDTHLTEHERQAAAAAAAWILAFNARWELGLDQFDGPNLGLVREHGPDYLVLDW